MLGVDPGDMFVYEDLADTEMKSKLESAALTLNQKHKNFAWVAVIILSHGLMKNGEDAIVGVNGNSVLVDDVCNAKQMIINVLSFSSQIRELFSARKIPEFQDKPKLFWFQACRVTDQNDSFGYSHQPLSTDSTSLPSVNQKPSLINQMVCISLIVMIIIIRSVLQVHSATIPKHSAYRSTMDGSFFIQDLCEVLQKHADDKTLDYMAMKVNHKVAAHNPEFQSMPEYKHTLTKGFKFDITEPNKTRFQQEKSLRRYQ